ncbi:Transmembrane protein [Halotydeus destructor]|nr:Transmembrane protein [Halotydeus destructor]
MSRRSDLIEDVEMATIDIDRSRFPHAVVWTPIPVLTWLFPFIGHMGITTSKGVIRDFAGPYYVSEDEMAFGKPTRYLTLNLERIDGGQRRWDSSVKEASNIYGGRIHNLLCDNCHSHVALALNTMKYDGKERYNMIQLAFWTFFCAKYVSFPAFLKTWLPFLTLATLIFLLWLFSSN